MEINLKDLPFDVDFHPSDSLVATGLINGYLLLHRYAAEAEPQRLLKVRAHKKSCRATRFINEGRAIVTGSPDCSILATDVETGAKIAHLENAHTAAVNRIINLTETTIASGDDAGIVKVDKLPQGYEVLLDSRQWPSAHKVLNKGLFVVQQRYGIPDNNPVVTILKFTTSTYQI